MSDAISVHSCDGQMIRSAVSTVEGPTLGSRLHAFKMIPKAIIPTQNNNPLHPVASVSQRIQHSLRKAVNFLFFRTPMISTNFEA